MGMLSLSCAIFVRRPAAENPETDVALDEVFGVDDSSERDAGESRWPT
jgi:hypothetical protein